MLITIQEIFYAIAITAVLAYIFMDFIKPRNTEFFTYSKSGFDWDSFKFAAMVAAPGVILHELAHKFTGMAFGYTASFEVFWFGLFLGVFLKLIRSPFLLIAPGYVTLPGITNSFHLGITAFAGPFINLVLWLGSWTILSKAKLTRKQAEFFYLTKQINMILFIFNMIPFGPFDGAKVLTGIIGVF